MKKYLFLLLLLFTFGKLSAQVQIDTAINFSVKDIHGETIELYPLLDEGKLVVIDFFSTSCGPCALYAPEVQASYEDFGENQGNVFFLSICWGDDNAGVAYFDSIYGITHPSVSGSQGGGNIVHNDYMVMSTPTVILIGSDREIIEHHIWEPTRDNLNAAITAAGGSMVGTEEAITYDKLRLNVYPNPASNYFNVRFEVVETDMYSLEIVNLLGKSVFNSIPRSYSSGQHLISADIDHLPGGTYFIRILRNNIQTGISRMIIAD